MSFEKEQLVDNFICGLRLMKFAGGTAKIRKAGMKEEKTGRLHSLHCTA
jgi:hypothetical protein